MERKAEIIAFSVMSLGAFIGGIVFVFSTPPTVYDLIISVFYGVASVGAALQACDTYIEARKDEEKWKQFITMYDSADNVSLTKNVVMNTLRKKRKKNGRRKHSKHRVDKI